MVGVCWGMSCVGVAWGRIFVFESGAGEAIRGVWLTRECGDVYGGCVCVCVGVCVCGVWCVCVCECVFWTLLRQV